MIRRKSTSPAMEPLPLEQCLAKSRVKDGETLPGRTVEEHCRITGAVAQALLSAFPPCTAGLFPEGSDLAVAVHDTGKVFPFFQAMIHKAAHDAQRFPQLAPFLDAPRPLSHASVSRAALLKESFALAEVAGWHHGFAPEACSALDEICGGEGWQQLRLELIRRLREGRPLPSLHTKEEKTLLKGLTAVADWIGSGSLFDDPGQPWPPLVPRAVEEAGFFPLRFVPDLAFQDIFGFAPNAVQKALAQAVTGPGVYVLEAPMGTGKTEAALFAAYRLLAAQKARGLYFALPTQLTSNNIFARLLPFLHTVLAPESRQASALLLHGMAWLYATHNEEGKNAASWFEQSRRGLLAPFGAGTLDQALMSVINVRHAAVRSFGLAGKVVILDEVHSYDAYTGTLLDALVEHLRALGCTVILLSATLTRLRRASIIGREGRKDAYPLITALPAGESPLLETGAGAMPCSTVQLRQNAAEEEALNEALLRAGQGQQVLWIENSVTEAQALFRIIAARAAGMNVETGLLHSRFTPADREHNESRWTALYGKNSGHRTQCGRILVGTQVLEQSLDIDADFLITRLCPTDMLFQRLGRLWRHTGTPRPAKAVREAWLLAPEMEAALACPATAFGISGLVYAPYVLARTLEVWNGKTSVSLPADIRPMLEATYAEREETAALNAVKRDLLRKVEQLRSLALAGRSDGSQRSGQTRLVEEETCPVLLVRSLSREGCTLADGRAIRFNAAPRREISAALFSSIVRIRKKSSAFTQSVNTSEEKRRLFQPYLPVKENYEPLFLARIRPDDVLEDLCAAGHTCGRYTTRTGWEKEDLPE